MRERSALEPGDDGRTDVVAGGMLGANVCVGVGVER